MMGNGVHDQNNRQGHKTVMAHMAQATGRDTYILIGLYILKQGPFAAGL